MGCGPAKEMVETGDVELEPSSKVWRVGGLDGTGRNISGGEDGVLSYLQQSTASSPFMETKKRRQNRSWEQRRKDKV